MTGPRDTQGQDECVAIVGVGNSLARDEGVGPTAVARLREADLPEGVELIDAADDLLGVMDELAAFDRVILVDAVRAGRPPGTIHRLRLEELEARAADLRGSASAHDFTVTRAVKLARLAGTRIPPLRVFGIEPAEVRLGVGLSEPVEAALERVVEEILDDLRGSR